MRDKDMIREIADFMEDTNFMGCKDSNKRNEFRRLLKELEKEIEKDRELLEPEKLAVLFHTTYERLAKDFGYATRKDTNVFNPESLNGRLMIATCVEIIKAMKGK
jgi:hypothetical protein